MARHTPLFKQHQKLQARIVDFAGWEMPVQYPTGILKEHAATREAVGLFDTCHMGEFLFEGPQMRAALNQILAGAFDKLGDGRERYTFITDENGGVIDDAVVMMYSDEKAWMVVNAGDIEGDFQTVCSRLPERITATDISDKTAKLDVQGPGAWEVIKTLTNGYDFRTMPFYSFIETEWQGYPMVLSRSGYTGEPGVELYVDAGCAVELWDAILATDDAVTPCGLGARDTLRLEAGLPLYGHELTRELNQVQAGFVRFSGLKKEEDFPGKSALLAAKDRLEKNDPTLQVMVGLRINDKRTPRAGFKVLGTDGNEVGFVTSGAMGQTVGAPIALAYVSLADSAVGTELGIEIRGKSIPATVVELPFYNTPAIREKI